MKKAIIIGGGIAGLSAAIALKKAGISCRVYEAAPEIRRVGAGIIMASNAMQVFGKLGIAEKVRAAGIEPESFSLVDQNFKTISKTEQGWIRKQFGYGMTSIHRGNLQRVLIEELGSEHLLLDKKFVSYTKDDDGVEAEFEDGTTARGDLLIGADGIHSGVRNALYTQEWGSQNAPKFRQTNQTCWRGVSKMNLPDFLQKDSIEAWGNQRRFGIIRLNEEEVYWFAVQSAMPGGTDNPVRLKSDLKNIFSNFNPLVQKIIENTPDDKIIRNDLYDFKPVKKWYSGNVGLIGDAAHPTTPNMGQGGCQAVEDAGALYEIFRKEKGIERALQMFENQRFAKTKKITDQSFSFGKIAHIGFGRGIRNFMFRQIPDSMARKSLDWIMRISE